MREIQNNAGLEETVELMRYFNFHKEPRDKFAILKAYQHKADSMSYLLIKAYQHKADSMSYLLINTFKDYGINAMHISHSMFLFYQHLSVFVIC